MVLDKFVDSIFLERYLKDVINLSIEFRSSSAISNGFNVKVVNCNDGIFKVLFIPYMPFDVLIDKKLYFEIGQSISMALIPRATYLISNGMVVESTNSKRLEDSRALVYRFMSGNINRLLFKSFDDIKCLDGVIPLMSNGSNNFIGEYDTNIHNNMIGVSGISGGGKSYMLLYLASAYYHMNSDIFIVDPKVDDKLFKFSKNKKKCQYLCPNAGFSDLDFVTRVKNILMLFLQEISKRQLKMANDSSYKPRRMILIIDELAALTATLDRKVKKDVINLITKIVITGRASRIGVIFSAQQFNADVLPTICREQLSLKIMLNPQLNKQNCSFLFPELENPEEFIIPNDGMPFGKGIMQVSDGISPILPLLAPTVGKGDVFER